MSPAQELDSISAFGARRDRAVGRGPSASRVEALRDPPDPSSRMQVVRGASSGTASSSDAFSNRCSCLASTLGECAKKPRRKLQLVTKSNNDPRSSHLNRASICALVSSRV